MKQPIVHFTRLWYGVKAAFTFNPAQPTSLLYKRTPDGGYELVGAMYTAPKRDSEDQLNKRVPLSIARWHRHINLCFPKKGTDPSKVDWMKFGMGSIATRQACDAGGRRLLSAAVSAGWCMSTRGRKTPKWSGRTDLPGFRLKIGPRLVSRDSVRSMRW